MNKPKICDALADWPEDKQGTGTLLDLGTGCYCALGWMGHKAGIPDNELIGVIGVEVEALEKAWDDDEDEVVIDNQSAYDKIKAEYELTSSEMEAIWNTNDNYRGYGCRSPKESVLKHVGCQGEK